MNELLLVLLIFCIAYLFGSFPTAFLLVKWSRKKDIREIGSGNVGALNAYRATQNKSVGLVALILDLLKGWLPVFLFRTYCNHDFFILLALVSGVLLGHCYPVWLKFKGGRGLAATAGALLAFKPILVAIWLGLWIVYFILIRRHILASLIATFLLPMIVFFTQGWLFDKETLLMILPVSMLIFMKHLERLPDLMKNV